LKYDVTQLFLYIGAEQDVLRIFPAGAEESGNGIMREYLLSGKKNPATEYQLQDKSAADETRTHTPFGTTPSRWHVYQFHHRSIVRLRRINEVWN
jgi:hypothetical protein